MDYLSKDAATDFYDLSYCSYANGIISSSQYFFRLKALTMMLQPENILRSEIINFLGAKEYNMEDEWFDNIDKMKNSQINSVNSKSNFDSSSYDDNQDQDDPFIIHFHPGPGSLSKWFFHIGDADNFPSVPHGHYNKNSKHKLDPYLGWEYLGSRQVNRVNKRDIIQLWNDDKFRSFAKSAILQFITNNPHFKWRASFTADTAMRIPRKQKL